jgi:hypothetical protein
MTGTVLLLLAVTPQGNGGASAPPGAPVAAPSIVAAARAPVHILLDGRDDDDAWRTAAPITAFREFQPREDADPRYRTEARVAYDAHHFYVFVRAFDPAPDSILRLLARRDVRTPSDQLKIIIDSYYDRRTGYEFAVNPARVKRDYAIYDDANEDDAWDGVWDVATRIDSLGWTAEFRIPLSQLRYAPADTNTFGFGVWRDIERHTERVSWPVYRRSQAGLASQLGEVTGLIGLPSPARLELMPYGVAKSVPLGVGEREAQFAVGADLKYGLTSNLTLDATVNPDFGQVEADPSVLNLSAFETLFQERRPFFVEGTGIFRYDVNCSAVNCSGENLFYSRRVGRRPSLRDDGDVTSPIATTIIGAAKLTGRLPGGLSLGLLEAATAREEGTPGNTIEPFTNYVVLRAQQDLRNGQSGIGFIGTAVNRNLDQWTEDALRRSAYVAAVDARHRFSRGRYEIAAKLAASRVDGTSEAIAATQTSNVHLFQRPDAYSFDPTRTTLWGDAEEFYVRKVGGGMIRFETSYQRRSPGFEINDLGILRRADQQSWNTWAALQFQKPQLFFRQGFWNFNWWQIWTTGGLETERAANTNAHFQLNNRWWAHAGGTLLLPAYCDACARGGPAVRRNAAVSAWAGVEGDTRFPVVPFLFFNYWGGDGGRSEFVNVNPSVDLRIASRFTTSLGLSLSRNRDDWQWYDNFTDSLGVTSYTFAHLVQRTASLNWRLDYTMSPTLSLQLYASPFVSKGSFSSVRQLAQPRAADYADRFAAYGDTSVTNNPGSFNFKQFRSNVVLRWEYRPGSTLFVVWSQGRDDFENEEGGRTLRGDFDRLFDAYPMNTFLVKFSYWLNR